MKKQIRLVFFFVVLAGLMLAACTQKETAEVEKEQVEVTRVVEVEVEVEVPAEAPEDVRYGGTFTYAYPVSPERFYPPQVTSVSQQMLMQQVFGALINWEMGAPSSVYPDVAESWDISDDGLVYTFHLREDATFHNGRQITADDVVFSLNEYAKEGMPHSTKFAIVESMEAPDDLTVVITLNNSNQYFLQSIAGPKGSFVMPRDVVEDLGDDYGSSPENFVGSGPFTLAEWTDTEIVFEAFDDWYDGRPYLDRWEQLIMPDRDTRILELRAGNVDMLYLDPPYKQQFLADPEWVDDLAVGSRSNTWFFLMDPDIPPFDDIRVRQAINWAVDMDRLLEITRGGVATTANQITPPGLDGHDNSIQYYRPRDLNKARELLAEAGYGEGDLSIQMYVWNRKSATTDMEFLASQISEAGINAEIVPVEFSTYLSEMGKGTYGFFVTGQTWGPDSADWMAANWHSEGPRNGIGYNNPEVDALLDKANLETDLDVRGELIADAERLILEDSVYVPYFHDKDAIAIQSWVHGLLRPNIAATGQGFWVTRFEKVWLDPEFQGD